MTSLLAAMDDFAFFAPAHNPPYIAAMKAFRNELPGVPLVAVFETIPYASLDEAATTYAVPYEWRTKYGIRRYGFHGASHRAASENVRKQFNKPGLRHISCHLGGSSSIAAFRDGVAIDTSFGTSPQSGLPQNNRVGDIDSFAVLHMMKKLNVGPDEMARILGSQSGLAGISGTSGDMRDLDQAAAAGSKRARLALDVFVRAIRHYLGAFHAGAGRRGRHHLLRRHRREQLGDARRGVQEPGRLRHRNGRGEEPHARTARAHLQQRPPRSRF